jgi:transketolase
MNNNFESVKESQEIRSLIIDSLEFGDRGHVGSSFSLVEIFISIYTEIANISPEKLSDPSRDKVILSKGHGCLAQYAILAHLNFFDKSDLKTFCKFESNLGGHPEFGHVEGIEASTGSLGHGLSIASGLALSSKIKKMNSKIFVILGDGELGEGSNWEALLSASKNKLDNLFIIVDYNKMQSYDYVSEVCNLEPLFDKFISFGCDVLECNGHDVSEITSNLVRFQSNQNGKPKVLIAHTIKGKGVKSIENDLSWHHRTKFTKDEIDFLREEISRA